VTVALKNGKHLSVTRDFPKGDPQEPLTRAEIEQKFLDNAAARHSAAQGRKIAALVRELPALDDATPLFDMLAR
jgi:2-methylcitrate dehydratase PrpD